MKTKFSAALASAIFLAAPQAVALQINSALRTAVGGQADGPRDLGQNDLSSNEIVYLNFSPRVSIEFSQDWTMYLRGRAFLPSGDVIDNDETQSTLQRETKSFVKLDEAWIRYSGFTSYPGESVRIGHQFVRENDRSWLGRDVDAIYWVLNTTRFTSSAGVFYQFSPYRSDGIDLPPEQRKRIYGHGNFSTDWLPEHQVGFRALHARDVDGSLPSLAATTAADSKLEAVNLTWLGVYFSNGYLNARNPNSIKYWADVTYLFGDTVTAGLANDRSVARFNRQSIGAVASTVAVRWRPGVWPVSVGAEYAYSGGGGKSQYRQSGIQGNSVQFTGASASSYRYNEALRAQLGNLRIATLYASLNLPSNDFSIVLQKFNKDDRFAPIVTNNLSVGTVGGSTDVGYGLDFIASHYLQIPAVLRSLDDGGGLVTEDPRSSIRLRASLFNPGNAYAAGSDINYRVIVEATLWWF
jgi:alginate production protein